MEGRCKQNASIVRTYAINWSCQCLWSLKLDFFLPFIRSFRGAIHSPNTSMLLLCCCCIPFFFPSTFPFNYSYYRSNVEISLSIHWIFKWLLSIYPQTHSLCYFRFPKFNCMFVKFPRYCSFRCCWLGKNHSAMASYTVKG